MRTGVPTLCALLLADRSAAQQEIVQSPNPPHVIVKRWLKNEERKIAPKKGFRHRAMTRKSRSPSMTARSVPLDVQRRFRCSMWRRCARSLMASSIRVPIIGK